MARSHLRMWFAVYLAAAIVAAAPTRCRAQESATWPDEREAGPFYCHADFSLTDSGPLLREMAELQVALLQTLNIQPDREPIHIFLFEREPTYRDYVDRYFPQVPYRRALFIKEQGPGMVLAYRHAELATDLRHECTHAFLHTALPMVPLWLDEGLAEYFEVAAAARAHGNPHLKNVKWSIRFGMFPRLERLEQIDKLDDMGQSEYRQAWAWVHFMLHGPLAAHDELVRYLGDIQAHSPPGTLSRRLRQRIPDLEKRLAQHFAQWHR